MDSSAVLSHQGNMTSFSFLDRTIRFRTSPLLERYTKVVEWDHGYLVVMAKYAGHQEEEEYIDLVPILENLYINADYFLRPIKEVKIQYA